jgi:hypothetical protein
LGYNGFNLFLWPDPDRLASGSPRDKEPLAAGQATEDEEPPPA